MPRSLGICISAAAAFIVNATAISAQGPGPAPPPGSEVPAIEQAIDEGYKSCFRDFDLGGKIFRLRIPFGENGERVETGVFEQQIAFGGKAGPREIWPRVASLLASYDFQEYADALAEPGEKVVILYIDTGSWAASGDPEELNRLTAAPYPGTRTQICVVKGGSELREEDIYNYLYCVGSVGMDCSGFVYFIQESIARALGADLDQVIGGELRIPAGMVARAVGLWYFDPASGHADNVDDLVSNLRPGDILLFRGRGGEFRHSAVIQSIDRGDGVIRYVQCTDWAPRPERGVHDSSIYFDPENPDVSLRDPSVRWTQRVLPTFEGEPGLRYWRNDGDRYRTEWPTGHSLVVRLKPIERLIEEADPTFYGRE
jgi:hypothetical protein